MIDHWTACQWRVSHRFRAIGQVDDVTRLYVNVDRHLRVSSGFDAGDGQDMLRCVEADMFGAGIDQLDDATRRAHEPGIDGLTCRALDKHLNVRLLERFTQMARRDADAFGCCSLRCALARRDQADGFGYPFRNSPLFDRNGGCFGGYRCNCVHGCTIAADPAVRQRTRWLGTSSAIRLRRGPRSQCSLRTEKTGTRVGMRERLRARVLVCQASRELPLFCGV